MRCDVGKGNDRLGGERVSEFEDLDSFSGHSLIPSDRDNFLSFSKYSSPFSYVLTMSGCDIQFVLVEKNMSHLLLWRDILTGEVGKQGLYPGSSLVKRSQTWDLSMCPFFVAPSHKGPCPLKEILLSFIRFIIYAFLLIYICWCALFTFTDWFMKEYKCKIYIEPCISWHPIKFMFPVILMTLAWLNKLNPSNQLYPSHWQKCQLCYVSDTMHWWSLGWRW